MHQMGGDEDMGGTICTMFIQTYMHMLCLSVWFDGLGVHGRDEHRGGARLVSGADEEEASREVSHGLPEGS
jgi:hypothetical protein